MPEMVHRGSFVDTSGECRYVTDSYGSRSRTRQHHHVLSSSLNRSSCHHLTTLPLDTATDTAVDMSHFTVHDIHSQPINSIGCVLFHPFSRQYNVKLPLTDADEADRAL